MTKREKETRNERKIKSYDEKVSKKRKDEKEKRRGKERRNRRKGNKKSSVKRIGNNEK